VKFLSTEEAFVLAALSLKIFLYLRSGYIFLVVSLQTCYKMNKWRKRYTF